jgi:hypothetical protein
MFSFDWREKSTLPIVAIDLSRVERQQVSYLQPQLQMCTFRECDAFQVCNMRLFG